MPCALSPKPSSPPSGDEEQEDGSRFEPTVAEIEMYKQRMGINSALPVMGRPGTATGVGVVYTWSSDRCGVVVQSCSYWRVQFGRINVMCYLHRRLR